MGRKKKKLKVERPHLHHLNNSLKHSYNNINYYQQQQILNQHNNSNSNSNNQNQSVNSLDNSNNNENNQNMKEYTTSTTPPFISQENVDPVTLQKSMPELPGYYYDYEKNRYFKITKENKHLCKGGEGSTSSTDGGAPRVAKVVVHSEWKGVNIENLIMDRELLGNTKINGVYHNSRRRRNNYSSNHNHNNSQFTDSMIGNQSMMLNNSPISRIQNTNNYCFIEPVLDYQSITKGLLCADVASGMISTYWLGCQEYNDEMNNQNNNNNNNNSSLNSSNGSSKLKVPGLVSSTHSIISDLSGISVYNEKFNNMAVVTTLGNAGQNGTASLISIEDHSTVKTISLKRESVWSSEWHPMGNSIAIGASGSIYLWDIESGSISNTFVSKSDIFSLCFSANGQELLAGSRDGNVRTFDTRINTIVNNNNNLNSNMNNSINNQQYINSIWDNNQNNNINNQINQLKQKKSTIKLNKQYSMVSTLNSICSVKLLSDQWNRGGSNCMITSSMNGTVSKWDRRMNLKLLDYNHHKNTHNTMIKMNLCHSNQYMCMGGTDKYLRIWSVENGTLLRTIGPFESTIRSCQLLDQWYDIDHDYSFNTTSSSTTTTTSSSTHHNNNNFSTTTPTHLSPILRVSVDNSVDLLASSYISSPTTYTPIINNSLICFNVNGDGLQFYPFF